MSSVLCIANCYVPLRARKLPTAFDTTLSPDRNFDVVYSLGNNGADVVSMLNQRFRHVVTIRGPDDVDQICGPVGESMAIQEVADTRILGVAARTAIPTGDVEALAELARTCGAKVVLHADSRTVTVQEHRGILIVGAGSATGVPLPGDQPSPPCLVCLIVKPDDVISIWVYHIVPDEDGNDTVVYDKHQWSREHGLVLSSTSAVTEAAKKRGALQPEQPQAQPEQQAPVPQYEEPPQPQQPQYDVPDVPAYDMEVPQEPEQIDMDISAPPPPMNDVGSDPYGMLDGEDSMNY